MVEQTPYTDTAYWIRLRQGDAEALGYFYDNYVDKLFSVALRITNDRELAKDGVQEVFIELWNYRETLSNVNNSQGYLIKVLRSILLKKAKKESFVYLHLNEELLISSEKSREDNIIFQEIEKEKKSKLSQALSHLTNRQKLILKLHFYEGLSYEQIADKLCINYQSVSNLAFRTILRLRNQMYISLFIIHTILL